MRCSNFDSEQRKRVSDGEDDGWLSNLLCHFRDALDKVLDLRKQLQQMQQQLQQSQQQLQKSRGGGGGGNMQILPILAIH